ncbi:MAG TPA: hypothetical protein VJB67_01335 [Patescibacteria group bacterium]|nr:hypothetical protein [Patescibacteria group bacterium]
MQLNKILIGLLLLAVLASPALAAEFDPDYLISDSEMNNYNSMDLNDIVRFINRREGTLKDYITVDKEGNFITATQTFYEVAQKWMINPKYLLILVQKEMSLLTDTSPKQTQYDWATGYGCPDGSGCNTKWKGFYKQVNSAAAQTRYYLDNINEFNYRPGQTYNIDGQTVSPKNTATAGLYNYTPHIHGNELFWNLWNKYFGKKWPDGSLLQVEGKDIPYYIEDGLKREIASKSVFISRFDPDKIIEVSQADLDSYEEGVPIKYHNFSLLKNSRGDIYMIIDDQKRKIVSPEVFNQIGFSADEVISVADLELDEYGKGPDITQYTIYPTGTLLKDETSKEIYYVLSGKKQLIINNEIMDYNFKGLTVESASALELNKFRTGSPVTLPDGELVKVPGISTVYIISNGKRLPIFNSNIFTKMKYDWDNIISIRKDTLDVHPLGQTITGDW